MSYVLPRYASGARSHATITHPTTPDSAATCASPKLYLSSLEHAFGFEEPNFREYMLTRNTDSASSFKLTGLAVEMDTSVHPIVMYAAGSAATEAACHRRASGGMDQAYDKRMRGLDFAEKCWTIAKDQFAEAEKAANNPVRRADYRSFADRAGLALAHLPIFEVITDWRTTDRFAACYTDEAMDETRENLIGLARGVLQESRDQSYNRQHQIHYGGLRSELLAHFLLQRAVGGSGLIIPSSLRQDHNNNPSLRADLVKITTGEPHVKTLIQISGPRATKKPRDVLVLGKKDLVSPSNKVLNTSMSALTAVIDSAAGIPQSPEVEAELAILTEKVANRLRDHEAVTFSSSHIKDAPQ